ncbi:hypothetical protein ANN_19107 [Periplaneta americana]|uniref:Integrase zinc-binding domain-containing protein n=1 Tax=Periplaneta americana TaxID=6978 RepID=A0ABQ8S9H5_PERAM|nr:hypothetical protein ANN_19107 [Periplaneta americana]
MAPYKLREDILCSVTESDQKPKVVVPNELDQVVLKYYHDSPPGGHLGVYKTLAKIREQFTCKGMGNQVSQYVKACIAFGLSKPALRTKYGQLAPSLADRPVEKLFVDCVGSFPRSKLGNRFCFDAGISHITTVPYYTNPSPDERGNRNLRSALIAYHADKEALWDSQ